MQFVFSLDQLLVKPLSKNFTEGLEYCIGCKHEILFVTQKPLFTFLPSIPITHFQVNLVESLNYTYPTNNRTVIQKRKGGLKRVTHEHQNHYLVECANTPLMVFVLNEEKGSLNLLSSTNNRWNSIFQHRLIKKPFILFTSDRLDCNAILNAKESVYIGKNDDVQLYAHWKIKEEEIGSTLIKMCEKYQIETIGASV